MKRDERGTEAPAENPPEATPREEGESPPGGPYGNPEVDEEALRKRQEEKGPEPEEQAGDRE